MKKIIIAFTGNHFSISAFEFIKKINQLQPVLVTGVFLPQYDFSNLWLFTEPISGQSFIPEIEEDEEEKRQNNMEKFAALCKLADIQYKIHEDSRQLSVSALIDESRFADLLIINSEKFYEYMGT